MRLYNHWRASSPYRVRIALAIKGLAWEHVGVNLSAAEQKSAAYRALNPIGLVPTLVDDELIVSQSLAIIEYLEERYPQPPLLPPDVAGRARVRSLALIVACEIHPLNNPRVLNYLTGTLGVSEEQKNDWYRHWIAEGLAAMEAHVANEPGTGLFCHGDTPTLADICLVPQLANARRYRCDLAPYPTLVAIESRCQALPAFRAALPERQPDAPKSS
jgi:maleylacetoacetate isomerase